MLVLLVFFCFVYHVENVSEAKNLNDDIIVHNDVIDNDKNDVTLVTENEDINVVEENTNDDDVEEDILRNRNAQ